MKDNNDDKLEKDKVEENSIEEKDTEGASDVTKEANEEVIESGYGEEKFVFRENVESKDTSRDTGEIVGDIDKKAMAKVIGIFAAITVLSLYNFYIVYIAPISFVISIIGNFYYKWKIKNSTGNVPLYRGLKKGFFIWMIMLLVPIVGILILFGSCMMLFAV